MTKPALIKANMIGAGLGSVHYHHGRKHGSVQADLALEKRAESSTS